MVRKYSEDIFCNLCVPDDGRTDSDSNRQEQKKSKLVRRFCVLILVRMTDYTSRMKPKTPYVASGDESQLRILMRLSSIKTTSKNPRLAANGYHLPRTSSMVSKTSHVPPYWNHSCAMRSLRRIGSKWRRLFISPWFVAATSPLFVLTMFEPTSFAILTKNLLAYRTMSIAFLKWAEGHPQALQTTCRRHFRTSPDAHPEWLYKLLYMDYVEFHQAEVHL